MANVLIVYGTTDGHTAKVATRIAEVLSEQGHAVERYECRSAPPALTVEYFDGVIVGASVHYEKHQDYVAEFVKDHAGILNEKRSAFFSVSLSAGSANEEEQEAIHRIVEEFLEEAEWHPDQIGLFAGALLYREYGFFKRWMMKRVIAKAGGDADPSRNYEYTDWELVSRFAREFGETFG